MGDEFPGSISFTNSDVVALHLEHSGATDALLSRLLVYEKTRGYSNVVQFSNPVSGKSSEYQGVSFQIENIGNQPFIPVIVARNVGTETTTVSAKVPYTRANGTRATITLPSEQLGSGEMRPLNVQAIIQRVAQEQIKVASLEVTYDTAPGTVIVAAHSYSYDHNQVFRVPMWDPLSQRSSTGGYPWRIEGTSVTETYIKNITDVEEDYVAFLVLEDGSIYMIGLNVIAPHETIHIDVKKLRDDQIPDERGRKIPLNFSSGQLQWTLRRKDNLPDDDSRASLALIGRSEQVDLAKKIVNNYSCQNCCASTFKDGKIEVSENGGGSSDTPPDPIEPLEVQSSRPYVAVEYDVTCNGFVFGYVTRTIVAAGWTTSNSNIATVNNGNVTAVGAGNVQISASWIARQSMVVLCPTPPPGRGELSNEPKSASLEYLDTLIATDSSIVDDSDKGKDTVVNSTPDASGCTGCHFDSQTAAPVITLSIKPKVQKIQYQTPGTSTYVDTTNPLYVLKGTTVNFRAIPYPNNATFGSGEPTWSGSSGATGTGQDKAVTFNTISSSLTNYKTVIASNGTPVIGNVIVFDLFGILTPEDNFDPNRSTIRFGLTEVVNLSFAANPAVTLTQIGGLRWAISYGTGTLPPLDNGTGQFTAASAPESTVLKLEVLSGPSKAGSITKSIAIVAPSGATLIKWSNIEHTQGVFGGSFKGYVHFEPKDVSFKNLVFQEGPCLAMADGYFESFNNQPHPSTGQGSNIGHCNLLTGCRTLNDDTVSTGHPVPVLPFRNGTFRWDVPWYYYANGNPFYFFTAVHYATANTAGTATLQKAGAGPYTINVGDPTSGY